MVINFYKTDMFHPYIIEIIEIMFCMGITSLKRADVGRRIRRYNKILHSKKSIKD